MKKLIALAAVLVLAGCASRNDGWSPAMNAAVVGHYRAVNGAEPK
jgi:uncharacterized lipoprotein YajG